MLTRVEARISFIVEEAKKTVLDFLKGTLRFGFISF